MKHLQPIQTFERDTDKDFRPVIKKAGEEEPAPVDEPEEKKVTTRAGAAKKLPSKP